MDEIKGGATDCLKIFQNKILKQVEYESARRKSNINEKQEKEMRKALHLSFFIL